MFHKTEHPHSSLRGWNRFKSQSHKNLMEKVSFKLDTISTTAKLHGLSTSHVFDLPQRELTTYIGECPLHGSRWLLSVTLFTQLVVWGFFCYKDTNFKLWEKKKRGGGAAEKGKTLQQQSLRLSAAVTESQNFRQFFSLQPVMVPGEFITPPSFVPSVHLLRSHLTLHPGLIQDG